MNKAGVCTTIIEFIRDECEEDGLGEAQAQAKLSALVDAENGVGQTPYSLAKERKSKVVCKLLSPYRKKSPTLDPSSDQDPRPTTPLSPTSM
mmetsp:Transcript_45380/g.102507  ORF Transcript_45380/g.102507 Transcript_45380/m.102507 type:complete len:92 (-) Transcript_45380:123-398(-)|eukprot:CAMPEP_0172584024 /NCGR_PEP_ID=MMETSP1068-20121228/3595_1 /TAXON_ID=35684 /ORGANISM="Pseudopedinella elastica, Strain CCMP716" /LENGTH=91 /DNA_ID=CAMNT_0013378047 /DNA_START=599 /DNA_END=874 /DNA_ORIENTATION=-